MSQDIKQGRPQATLLTRLGRPRVIYSRTSGSTSAKEGLFADKARQRCKAGSRRRSGEGVTSGWSFLRRFISPGVPARSRLAHFAEQRAVCLAWRASLQGAVERTPEGPTRRLCTVSDWARWRRWRRGLTSEALARAIVGKVDRSPTSGRRGVVAGCD